MRLEVYQDQALEGIAVPENRTLRETMTVMSRAGLRLVPVIAPEDGRFVGVVADGDLRRFIAAGGDLDSPVALAANRAPVVLLEDAGQNQVRSLMQRRGIEYLPKLSGGRIVALFVLWAASSPQQLTAVVMAGGLGTRLAPLTDACPKPLLPLGGKPILTHILEHLRDQGITRFILSVNYLGDMIVDHYGDGAAFGLSIDYVHETMRMGTGGALGLIDREALSEPFLCMNGDILSDLDVNALQVQHQTAGWDATMVVRDHSFTVPYGVVRQSEEGGFLGSEEKPTIAFRINAGIYMLSKSVLQLVPRRRFYDLPTLFDDLPARDLRGGVYAHPGRWIDVGNVADFQRAQSIFEGPPR